MLRAAVLVCNDGGARVMAVVVGRRAAKPGWLPCWGQQLAHGTEQRRRSLHSVSRGPVRLRDRHSSGLGSGKSRVLAGLGGAYILLLPRLVPNGRLHCLPAQDCCSHWVGARRQERHSGNAADDTTGGTVRALQPVVDDDDDDDDDDMMMIE